MKKYIRRQINKFITDLAVANANETISMNFLYKKGLMEQFNKKAVEDSAVLFTSYEDYVKSNLDIFRENLKSNSISFKDVSCLEFGVSKGISINMMSRILPECQWHGFDSFEGFKSLPTKSYWHVYDKAFRNQAEPKVNENVTLVKGYVEETESA